MVRIEVNEESQYGITNIAGVFSVYGFRNLLEIVNPQSINNLMKVIRPYIIDRSESMGDISVR